ncbi:MAG: hypothetical protein KGS45_02415 [Planctomycetes bacterium]|nr:hypothetical protein [Planctomycetota bacterium]
MKTAMMLAACGMMVSASSVVNAVPVTWQTHVGIAPTDIINGTCTTRDGGSIHVGQRNNAGASPDIWVVKLDYKGDVQWQRTIGTANSEVGYSVVETADGGFAISGEATGVGAGLGTVILKLNGAGMTMWARVYFGNPLVNLERPSRIIEMPNRDLVAVGCYRTTGQFLAVIRLNSAGVQQWAWGYVDPRYGNATNSALCDVHSYRDPAGTNNGGLLVCGWTGQSSTLKEPLVMWLDSTGAFVSASVYGTPASNRYANGLDVNTATSDSTYTLVSVPAMDTQVLRLDAALNPIFRVRVDNIYAANATIVNPAPEIVFGGTSVNPANASRDMSIFKFDSAAGVAFMRLYGGILTEEGRGMSPVGTGFHLAGWSRTFTFGGEDGYFVRTDNNLDSGCNQLLQSVTPAAQVPDRIQLQFPRQGLQFVQWTPANTLITTGQNILCRQCPADINGDGIVDFFDYLDYVAAFSGGLPIADFNGDGVIDFFDYLDFVAAFSSGC